VLDRRKRGVLPSKTPTRMGRPWGESKQKAAAKKETMGAKGESQKDSGTSRRLKKSNPGRCQKGSRPKGIRRISNVGGGKRSYYVRNKDR